MGKFMRIAHRRWLRATNVLGCSAAALALLSAPAAWAQQAEATEPGPQAEEVGSDIVVIGRRGSAVTDIAPVLEMDADAIAATGAATVPELMQAIRGATQSPSGGEPIFLLNAQRVSSYQEIGSLPPEAIEKVEVLPEQAALRFGFPPTRRVVNFITKARFRQIEVKGSATTTTRWGTATQKANLGLTRLQAGGRLTLGLELRRSDPLYQSERDLVPDPDIPFDSIGNITGVTDGEIDPALSLAAGQTVTIAPLPVAAADRNNLAAFATSGNRARLFDVGLYDTLTPRNEGIKAEAVMANRISETVAGSLSLSAEHSRDRAQSGPATMRLLVPATNPYSPFTRPVILNRYLTEAALLRQSEATTTLHAGVTLRGAIAGWRWDFTGVLDHKERAGRNDRGISLDLANAAIAAGANPFGPLDAALLAARLTDDTRFRTRTMGAKTVVNNTPIRLPAGQVTVTGTVEADQMSAVSGSRGPSPSNLSLGRARIEGGIAIDVPLTSRREKVLPAIGDLSLNASVNA
ncbi:MAG: TonB-dependent receptor, partial [Sphingomonadales bacterium]